MPYARMLTRFSHAWLFATIWMVAHWAPLSMGYRRKGQPTPVFLPGKFHGQRSLAGYSPWDHKELNMIDSD